MEHRDQLVVVADHEQPFAVRRPRQSVARRAAGRSVGPRRLDVDQPGLVLAPSAADLPSGASDCRGVADERGCSSNAAKGGTRRSPGHRARGADQSFVAVPPHTASNRSRTPTSPTPWRPPRRRCRAGRCPPEACTTRRSSAAPTGHAWDGICHRLSTPPSRSTPAPRRCPVRGTRNRRSAADRWRRPNRGGSRRARCGSLRMSAGSTYTSGPGRRPPGRP